MKKAIFFDIDGTLVTDDERSIIPESTINAIKLARKNGNYTFINTGRTVFNIEERIRNIGFDGFLCGCGTYIEYNNEILLYNTQTNIVSQQIVEAVREYRAIPLYERCDSVFFDDFAGDNPELNIFRKGFESHGIRTDRTVDEKDFHFDKFVIWTNKNTKLDDLLSVISKNFTVIDRGNGFFENVPIGFSKATAINVILSKLGISYENAYAIGDSTNDLPMLEAVPNSIAMGAGDAIKDYVSFVTKDIEDDGIEYALKHFKII